MSEPISVRIARLRGCEPVFRPRLRYTQDGQESVPQWRCECPLPPEGHHPIGWRAVLWDTEGGEAWLAPAASFALLAEMVEGPFQNDEEPIDGADVAIGKHGKLGYWFAANDGLNNQKASQLAYVDRASTLGEAIALAWIAWKGARQ